MSLSTDKRKEAMLSALEASLGVVSIACTAIGMDRSTHYAWLKSDPEYREAVEDLGNVALDFAENKLHKLMEDKNPAAVIFYLKTKGKRRGYIERHEAVVKTENAELPDWLNNPNTDSND